jgi:S1-C subfamily serine protease
MEPIDASVPKPTRWVLKHRARLPIAALAIFATAASIWLVRGSSSSETALPQTAASVKAAVDQAIAASEKKAVARPALSALAFARVVPSVVFIRTDEPANISKSTRGAASPGGSDTSVPSNVDPSSGDPSSVDSTNADRSNADTTNADTRAGDSNEESAIPGSSGAKTGDSRGDAPSSEERGGLGTGVIINAEGAILTANHVVEGAKVIRVTFADGSTSNATVISSEPDRDIAVLKADRNPEVVVPAVMGGGVRVGDEAFAIGHPLGLIDSMSSGIISGLNRSIPISDERTLDGLIQFDTAVNPGNSGGPLLNRAGQVVGIVTALANPSEQGVFIGIGFAVPIGTAAGAAGAGPGGVPR